MPRLAYCNEQYGTNPNCDECEEFRAQAEPIT
jgi:hypothetical protein